MLRLAVPLVMLFGLLAPATAIAWSEDPKTPEGWAWAQIKAGEVADFNEHCGKTLDPRQPAGWDDPCRQIPAQFLMDVLTVPSWQGHAGRHGVRLSGISIGEDIDLSDADIPMEFWLDSSRIEGGLAINDTHLRRYFNFDGSVLDGALYGDRLTADSDVSMQDHTVFTGEVSLSGATFGGDLDLETATFAKTLSIDGMHVHGSLYLEDIAGFAGDVDLSGTVVDGDVQLDRSVFAKTLDATFMDIHGGLSGTSASFAGDVALMGARVGSNLALDAAGFAGALNASSMDVKGALFLRNAASFSGAVSLVATRVGSDLEMTGSFFGRTLDSSGMEVHGRVLMGDHATFVGDVSMNDAKVGWLYMRGATASGLDLSDLSGSAGSELILNDMTWRCRPPPAGGATPATPPAGTTAAVFTWPLDNPSWRTASCPGGDAFLPALSLRNAHIESFQDSIDAWPPLLDLEGLHYDRLGGITGVGRADMRQRTPEQWVDWLDRDRIYSAQPYMQLAAVLTAAGRRDTAEAVLFAGAERERNEVWALPDVGSWRWLRHDFPAWLWQSFLAIVAGYGIGLYTFRVLWWVIGLTVLGAAVLWFSPYARQRNVFWRLGASLHRLLPVVELSKEFEEFFENRHEPHQPLKLHPWQMAFFAAIALAGWVLGFFLLAAMGGLTQK
jgi:hypothetical protein